ncbi:MAG TPA: MATE family efflux transporter, partial [Clostridia bacterium]|nr:MATE family efflux transporter [Clostridia bacterium]
MNRLQQDFTQGSIGSHLVRFSVPFLLSNLLQALYNVADMLIVGLFHGEAAGVNIGGQITNVVVMLVSGLTVGGTVLVAQYFGARRHADVQKTIGTLFSTLAIAGIALSLIMLLFSDKMLRLLDTPQEA